MKAFAYLLGYLVVQTLVMLALGLLVLWMVDQSVAWVMRFV